MEPAVTQTEGTPIGRARLRWTVAKFAVATLLLFLAPGLVLGLAAVAAVVTVLAVPAVYVLRRARFPRQLRRAGACTAFLLLAGVLTAVNMSLAESRLNALVDAMHAYHAERGAYPDTLAALVPETLERVPHATLWLTMNEFRWNPKGLLTCVPAPPIGWIGYDFRTEKRVALD